MVMCCKDIKVATACIFTVKTNASVACNAAVHLMGYERPEILVSERAFFKSKAAVGMACHYGHILKMAFPTFITNRAIVRMIHHQPLNHRCPKCFGFWIGD